MVKFELGKVMITFVPGQVHDDDDRTVDHAARLNHLRTPKTPKNVFHIIGKYK